MLKLTLKFSEMHRLKLTELNCALHCQQNIKNVTCMFSVIFCLIRPKKPPFEKDKQTEQKTKKRKEKKKKTSQEGQSGDSFYLVSRKHFSQTIR